MGWEFFELCLDPDLVYSLFSISGYEKEEGSMLEQQFVHWLSKQFEAK